MPPRKTTRLERQSSWAAGVLAPEWWGQIEKSFYAYGAKTLENFLVTKQGALINRAGAQLVDTPAAEARCVSWSFSETDSMVLVLVGGKMWGVKPVSGEERTAWLYGTNAAGEAAGLPDVSTPWSSSQIDDLRFEQLGNTMVISSPDMSQYRLVRTVVDGGPDTWALRELGLVRPEIPFYSWSLPHPPHPSRVGAIPGSPDHSHYIFARMARRTGEKDFADSHDPTNHPARPWEYAVQWVVRLSDGRVVVTKSAPVHTAFGVDFNLFVGSNGWEVDNFRDAELGHFVVPDLIYNAAESATISPQFTVPEEIAVYQTQPRIVFVGWDPQLTLGVVGSDWAESSAGTTAEIISAQVFRGRDGRFGYIGETTKLVFLDEGNTPDFSIVPNPWTRNGPRPDLNTLDLEDPFKIYENAVLVRTEYPRMSVFYEGRFIPASTLERGNRMWFSEVEYFAKLGPVPPLGLGGLLGSPPFTYGLVSGKAERIVDLVAANGILVLTSSGEYRIAGGNEEALTERSITVRKIGHYGAANIPAVVGNDAVFYVGNDSSSPLALVPSGDTRWYTVEEISVLASHLFEGRTVKRMAFSRRPYGVLWCVLDDGTMASMSWLPKYGILAWCHHTITGALVEDVCSVPEGREDAVYMITKRGIFRYLERLAYRLMTDTRDAIFLDSSKSWQSTAVSGETVTLSDPLPAAGFDDWAIEQPVTCTFAGGSGDEDEVIALLDPDGIEEPCFIQVIAVWASNAQTGAPLMRAIPSWAQGVSLSYYRTTQSLAGLNHLEGETVAVVVDGFRIDDQVVSAGTVKLDGTIHERTGTTSIHAGLLYNSDFASLDSKSAKGHQKIVNKVILELVKTRGGKVGSELTDDILYPVVQRDLEDSYSRLPLTAVEEEVQIADEHDKTGRVCFRQDEPFPCTLISITREIEDGGT